MTVNYLFLPSYPVISPRFEVTRKREACMGEGWAECRTECGGNFEPTKRGTPSSPPIKFKLSLLHQVRLCKFTLCFVLYRYRYQIAHLWRGNKYFMCCHASSFHFGLKGLRKQKHSTVLFTSAELVKKPKFHRKIEFQ